MDVYTLPRCVHYRSQSRQWPRSIVATEKDQSHTRRTPKNNCELPSRFWLEKAPRDIIFPNFVDKESDMRNRAIFCRVCEANAENFSLRSPRASPEKMKIEYSVSQRAKRTRSELGQSGIQVSRDVA